MHLNKLCQKRFNQLEWFVVGAFSFTQGWDNFILKNESHRGKGQSVCVCGGGVEILA